jgi:hypothetical protein
MLKILKALYEFFLRMEKQRRGLCRHCGGIRCYGACRFEDAQAERGWSGKKRPEPDPRNAAGPGKAGDAAFLRQRGPDVQPDKPVPE